MSISMITAQRDILLTTIRQITRGDWKVLILDPDSRRLIDNVLEEDAILNENITNIEQILNRRPTNRDVDALYLLTPQPHIVDALMADLAKRKYRKAHLVWTSLLHPSLRDLIDKSSTAREQIALFKVLNVEFFPRESHVVTFRDPWSFPILFHPSCNHLVRQHMEDVAQKIVGVCVSLGEYPTIRYYRPPSPPPSHQSSILCSHLARFVQDELDLYAKFHEDFPPASASQRPRGTLFILDRSLDLFAPLLHEFTYQAMAFDLLPIREGPSRPTFRTVINENTPAQQDKDIPILESDKLWLDNRHRHMAATIERLMSDFQRFIKDNPAFTKDSEGGANSLNAIKDMLAGLPQFQERKEAYALHLGMAQESMNLFQSQRLPDLGSVEQTMATGLDEELKRPKGLADQVIRLLDEPDVTPSDRLRLLMLYVLATNGLLPADLDKLLAHAQLSPHTDGVVLGNLALLGARISKRLKDTTVSPRLFPTPIPPPGTAPPSDEYALSRYNPALFSLLQSHASGALSADIFPYTKPPLDLPPSSASLATTTSLRNPAAKPTWAKSRSGQATTSETRQRVIVFMAGGATYSESRACYTASRETGREVVLVTSHMLTPKLFLQQIGDLSADRRKLNLPVEATKREAPKHLFEPDEKPVEAPVRQMANANLSGGGGGARPAAASAVHAPGPPPPVPSQPQANSKAKLTKEPPPAEKKKHRFGFGKKEK